MSQVPLRAAECALISELVYQRFGIVLGERKRALISGRLQKVLRDGGFASFQDYYDFVVSDASGRAVDELAERISTNHTAFHREPEHFGLLAREVLPRLDALTGGFGDGLRLWSAGCATGEEPYTLAMEVEDALGERASALSVLATDVSRVALAQAEAGVYPLERIRALPARLLGSGFEPTVDGRFRVVSRIRSRVLFRRLNLLRQSFPFQKRFHVIFCRNVMIYFDRQTREELAGRLRDVLLPGGYLFVGHAESLGTRLGGLVSVAPSAYRRQGGA